VTWQPEEFLVEYLRDAAEELRRRDREGLGEIRANGIAGPVPEGWRLIDAGYKRLRGPPSGPRSNFRRFFMDPNRVAAAIAAGCIADWREAGDSPRRAVKTADGTEKRWREAAAELAVDFVNTRYVDLLPQPSKKARVDDVVELLRCSRTDWPTELDF
jgi:hypothetical protein